MSRVYRNKEAYIGLLGECLKAKDDFNDIAYCRDHKGNEYLILSDIIGQIGMFEITGYSEERIFHTVAKVECGIEPSNIIVDPHKRLEIARLYRKL